MTELRACVLAGSRPAPLRRLRGKTKQTGADARRPAPSAGHDESRPVRKRERGNESKNEYAKRKEGMLVHELVRQAFLSWSGTYETLGPLLNQHVREHHLLLEYAESRGRCIIYPEGSKLPVLAKTPEK